MGRRTYLVDINVNGRKIDQVIIDSHYELKHGSTIDDNIIIDLVRMLDGKIFQAETYSPPFEYYVTDNLILHQKKYKLIWLLQDHLLFIGVVNAYRRT